MKKIKTLTQKELDQLYQDGKMSEIPRGNSDGIAIMLPDQKVFSEIFAKIASHVWRGKVFHADGRSLINKVFGQRLVKARVYQGKSLFDGKDSIIVDYSKTSLLARPIRDEIRQIDTNLYLGRAYIPMKKKNIFVLNFVLKF